ncbi:hypothetical protein ES332_D11G319100v1 [Gossypium tomentosum]|uniref:Uncharacterized protein n=1 Tax=Gossypium tomentosum TaxID=34277 RepID=A0A5D2IV06_GOSTO|nr:hypothetical protein ES332_D11G319100v1 [Gossypium tomentosum]
MLRERTPIPTFRADFGDGETSDDATERRFRVSRPTVVAEACARGWQKCAALRHWAKACGALGFASLLLVWAGLINWAWVVVWARVTIRLVCLIWFVTGFGLPGKMGSYKIYVEGPV